MELSEARMELSEEIEALAKRVSVLESKRSKKPEPQTEVFSASRSADDDRASIAKDAFAVTMTVKALAAGLKRFKFVRCDDDYYNWSLEKRRRYLDAPSTMHLCKSIVMVNKNWKGEEGADELDPCNSRFYCCVVSYVTKLSAQDLMRIIKDVNVQQNRVPPTNKNLHFRLAEDCVGVSGFPPNGVSAVGLKTPMPIVLDKELTTLEPPMFWMGGGEVNLKLSVDTQEFVDSYKPIIGTVTP